MAIDSDVLERATADASGWQLLHQVEAAAQQLGMTVSQRDQLASVGCMFGLLQTPDCLFVSCYLCLRADGVDVVLYDPRYFSEFVHKYGINIRHLGYLHQRCRLKHSKDLVCCDIIARTAKYLVGHSCRAILRKARQSLHALMLK